MHIKVFFYLEINIYMLELYNKDNNNNNNNNNNNYYYYYYIIEDIQHDNK